MGGALKVGVSECGGSAGGFASSVASCRNGNGHGHVDPAALVGSVVGAKFDGRMQKRTLFISTACCLFPRRGIRLASSSDRQFPKSLRLNGLFPCWGGRQGPGSAWMASNPVQEAPLMRFSGGGGGGPGQNARPGLQPPRALVLTRAPAAASRSSATGKMNQRQRLYARGRRVTYS
jgi:hypothetical protein